MLSMSDFENAAFVFALGGILSFLWSAIKKFFLYLGNRKEKNFLGEWFVESHSGDNKIGAVRHKVKVSTSLNGFIKIKSSGDARGYSYEGFGKIIDNRNFSGEWRSNNPGSHSNGAFLLMIDPQGRYMVGFYSGQDCDDKTSFHQWVFCRNESDIENAEAWLTSHIHNIN